jgi:hypothetical protein
MTQSIHGDNAILAKVSVRGFKGLANLVTVEPDVDRQVRVVQYDCLLHLAFFLAS